MEEKGLLFADQPYGAHERQRFDLCLPRDHRDRSGLILFIHGGAWIAGDKEGYRGELEKWSLRGIPAAAVNYRYIAADTHMDALLDDITSALAAIRDLSADHGVRLDRVMLTGGSAGGHLSLLYAYARAEDAPVRPVCVADYCGPTLLTDEGLLYGTPEHYPPKEQWTELFTNICGMLPDSDEGMDMLRRYSPVSYVTEKTVPTIICHGQKDDIVPFSNAVSLRDALEAHGVEYAFLPMPAAGHGLEQKEIYEESEALFGLYVKRFLEN